MNSVIFKDSQYLIYRFETNFATTYIPGIDEMYFQKKVRFLLNHLSNGELFYLMDCTTNANCGYCMVSKGKAFRYSYAKPDDITIGPIFLKPEYRGRRLSVLLLRNVIQQFTKSTYAFAYIRRTNLRSIALFSGTGFRPICGAETGKITKSVYCSQAPDSEYLLYRLKLSEYL